MNRSIPWLRVFVEGAVIVFSILLAFGIEAWWAERGDRVLEREYLERLLQDQQANREVLARLNRQQTSQLDNARRIYRLVSRGDWDGLDTTAAVVASYLASPSPTPTWVDDTFEELKSTGRIGLIRNAQVRSELLEYYCYLETADYTYELMSTKYRDAVPICWKDISEKLCTWPPVLPDLTSRVKRRWYQDAHRDYELGGHSLAFMALTLRETAVFLDKWFPGEPWGRDGYG